MTLAIVPSIPSLISRRDRPARGRSSSITRTCSAPRSSSRSLAGTPAAAQAAEAAALAEIDRQAKLLSGYDSAERIQPLVCDAGSASAGLAGSVSKC